MSRRSGSSINQPSIRLFFNNVDVNSEQLDEGMNEEMEQLPSISKSKPKSTRKTYPKEGAECIECKEQKKIHAKNMCGACYERARRTLPEYNVPNCCCIDCMAVAKVDKHGRCRKCSKAKYNKLWKENVDKYRECKECKQTKLIVSNGLCNKCYKRSKPKVKGTCQECGQTKILESKKFCANCQQKKLAKTDIRMCKNCGEMRSHCADQMCRQCYNKTRREDPKQYKECVKCKQTRAIHGRGMCEACCVITRKEDKTQHKECVKCNKIKFIECRGMCNACYSKDKAQQLKLDTNKHKKCSECKKVKPIVCRECCSACYQKIFTAPKQMVKRKLSKQLLIPKPEPVSSDEEDFGQEVNSANVKIEVSSGDEDEDFGQEADSTNIKTEKLDDQQPGPSWKY